MVPSPLEQVEVELEERSVTPRAAAPRLERAPVIELRFGLGGRDPLPLREVAKHARPLR